ncbi:MFS general substrate transporter [Penicillium malachiteum]|nr:MFS general substrate transporter [Penicillium malachiteum]
MDTHDENQHLLGTGPVQMEPTQKSQELTVMLAVSALILAVDFAFFIDAAPQTEIFQDIICQNYLTASGNHTDKIPTEGICKSTPVQSELALVNGWKDTSDVLTSIK